MNEFDPTSLGAVLIEDHFDPATLGAVPVESFSPESLGAVPVSSPVSTPPALADFRRADNEAIQSVGIPADTSFGHQLVNAPKVALSALAQTGDLTAQGLELQPVNARRQAEERAQKAQADVIQFERDFPQEHPDPSGVIARNRADLQSKLSQANNEAERMAKLVPHPEEVARSADFYRQSAEDRPSEFGVDPALAKTVTSKVAGGLAKGAGMFAQGAIPGIGLPLVTAQTVLEAGAQAGNEAEARALAEGLTDPAQIDAAKGAASDKAQAWTLLSTAAFMGQAAGVKAAIGKALGESATPLKTFVAQVTGGTLSNEATSRLTAAAQAAEAAPEGQKFEAVKQALGTNDPGTMAQSLGFGLFGGAHAAGEIAGKLEAAGLPRSAEAVKTLEPPAPETKPAPIEPPPLPPKEAPPSAPPLDLAPEPPKKAATASEPILAPIAGDAPPEPTSASASEAEQATGATTEPPSGTWQGQEPPGAGLPEGVTSIKNAQTALERWRRDIPPAVEPETRGWGAARAEAIAIIERDSGAADRLVSELEKTPRPLKDFEDAMLLHRQVELQKEYDRLTAESNAAVTAGDDIAVADANGRRNEVRDQLQKLYDVDKTSGTIASRGFNARKMAMKDDFTLARLILERRADKGRELTPEEHGKIEALSTEIQALQAKLAEHEAGATAAASDAHFIDAMRDLVAKVEIEKPEPAAKTPKPPKGEVPTPKEKSAGSKILDSITAKADEARARIRARRGQFNAGIDPSALYDHAVVGAEYFARGAANLGRFTAKLVTEFGEYVRPHAEEIFAKAREIVKLAKSPRDLNAERERITARIKEAVGEGDTVKDIAPLARALAENYVRRGVTEREPLIDAVHKELTASIPDLTRRQTMDAISGYGDFKQLDPEPVKAKLRELKGQMQQIGKLEDMKAKQAPKKTGVEQRVKGDEERRLIKEVNEAKKKGGFVVTDPKTQLRTALGAKERAVSNEIRDVANEIAINKRREAPAPIDREKLSPKEQKQMDRIDMLGDLLGRLRKTRDDVFGKPELTDEQRLTRMIDSANRSSDEYTRQVEQEDFARKKGKPKISNPEYEAAVARRKAARAERDEFKALDETVRAEKEAKKTQDLKDSIAELDHRLKTGQTATEARAEPLLTPAQEALVAERDAMLKLIAEIRRGPGKSDAERQVERLLKSVDELDRRLREGDIDPKKKGSVAALTPDAERLLAIRESMQRELREQQAAAKPRKSDAEIALARWKTVAANREAELRDRIARGYFSKKPTRTAVLDKDAIDTNARIAILKRRYNEDRFKDTLAHRTRWQKIRGTAAEVLNTSRAIMTSFDLSAVLRQGAFIGIANPIRALKAFPSMFKAALSDRGQARVEQEILSRPNAALYRQSKLYLHQEGGTLAHMEEAYMSRWAKKIPIVAASERAYVTYLNRIRADSFDAMAKNLTRKGLVLPEEGAAIANFINVATGRGDLGRFTQAGTALNTVFFAPRYVVSRFQLLLGQPLWKGTARTRGLVAKEYAKYLIGMGVVYSLAMSAGSDEVEKDPRSSDFGKIKFGNTRIDPLSGISQATVLLAREGFRQTVARKGEVLSLHHGAKDAPPEEKIRYGGSDTVDVATRFLRTKLSPAIGAYWNASSGQNVVGQPVTPGQAIKELLIPISFGDIASAMKEQGIERGAAIAILALLGMGVQNYSDNPKK